MIATFRIKHFSAHFNKFSMQCVQHAVLEMLPNIHIIVIKSSQALSVNLSG